MHLAAPKRQRRFNLISEDFWHNKRFIPVLLVVLAIGSIVSSRSRNRLCIA
jgi:hypothetical protein